MNKLLDKLGITKFRFIVNALVLAFMLIFLGICLHDSGFEPGLFLGAIGIAITIIIIKSTKFPFGKKTGIAMFFVSAVASFYLLEGYTHFAGFMNVRLQFLNIVFIIVLFAFFSFCLGSFGRGAGCGTLILMGLGVVNYYVVQFRGTPLLPWDFMSTGTAFTVTDNYKLAITYRVVYIIFLFILLFVTCFKINIKISFGIKRIVLIALSFAALIGTGKSMSTDFVVDNFGIDHTLFTPNVIYRNNGFCVSFLYNMQYIKITEPEGYSLDKVNELVQKYNKRAEEYNSTLSGDTPNIVVIVDETFSDLRVLGDFDTNIPVMPFVDSLKENTIKGYAYASVIGGNTPNSEFEFLTNSSMAFLPTGSIPFQQYIKGELPSFISVAKSQNYNTIGGHPYYAGGWDRNKVYPWLGFDKIMFKDDFRNVKKIRNYITDQTVFENIEASYERQHDGKLLNYFITMQNHGGFYKDYDNFNVDVELKGSDKKSTARYLSLLKKTDKYLEDFFDHLKDSKEKTIVIFFGDHQPNDDIVEPVLTLNGISKDTMTWEDQQNRYKVPFLIWANYDIPEMTIDGISINYLNIILSEAAGMRLSGYQMFVREAMEKVPVVTASVFIDSDGNYYDSSKGTAFEDTMKNYAFLQYNYLFGKENRAKDFFDIKEGS